MIKVMKEILVNAGKQYSVTEAAKQAGVSKFASKKCLDYLLERGMITLEKVGKIHRCQANPDSYLARQWKVIFSLEELKDAKVVENLLKKERKITNIIIYGSVATGKDDEHSDIDMLVVGDVSQKKKRELAALAQGTSRELNISVYTHLEWRKKASANKIFYEQVIIDSISLYGEKPVVL